MKWIFVKDRLPDKDGMVIIYAPSMFVESPFVDIAHYNPNGFGWSLIPEAWIDAIEAWMPLPEPPNKGNG